jgi:hypothetical protein
VFSVSCLDVHMPSSTQMMCKVLWTENGSYPNAGALGLQPDLMHACILFSPLLFRFA